jgi:hypothetical protein
MKLFYLIKSLFFSPDIIAKKSKFYKNNKRNNNKNKWNKVAI